MLLHSETRTSLSHTHPFRECCIFYMEFHRRCCEALFFPPHSLQKEPVPIGGNKCIKPLLAAADLFKTRERWSVQNSNTFLRVSGSSQPVPRGKWRRVYFRVRRNEVKMLRTQRAVPAQSQKYTHMNVHGNRRAHMKGTLCKEGLWLFWCAVLALHSTGPLSVKTWCLSIFHGSGWPWHGQVLKTINAALWERSLLNMLLWWWW